MEHVLDLFRMLCNTFLIRSLRSGKTHYKMAWVWTTSYIVLLYSAKDMWLTKPHGYRVLGGNSSSLLLSGCSLLLVIAICITYCFYLPLSLNIWEINSLSVIWCNKNVLQQLDWYLKFQVSFKLFIVFTRCMYVHAIIHVCRSDDNLKDLVFYFYHVRLRYWT